MRSITPRSIRTSLESINVSLSIRDILSSGYENGYIIRDNVIVMRDNVIQDAIVVANNGNRFFKFLYYKNKFIVDSENLLLMFFNIFIFIVIEIIFFWYILSYQIVYIIEDKAYLIVLAAQQNPDLKQQILEYLTNNASTDISQNAIIDKEARDAYNYQLIFTYLGPMIYAIFAILITIAFYKLIGYRIINWLFGLQYNGAKMSCSSYILLVCVIFSFLTEIIYYYVVINQWNFISDAEVILLMISS